MCTVEYSVHINDYQPASLGVWQDLHVVRVAVRCKNQKGLTAGVSLEFWPQHIAYTHTDTPSQPASMCTVADRPTRILSI